MKQVIGKIQCLDCKEHCCCNIMQNENSKLFVYCKESDKYFELDETVETKIKGE